ncbi:MAG: hypothetical protein J4N63_08335 [Chloroflexi bacterium]|nr:hypothetical protein [Chloroflexota bacterium]MCI0874119.1 hypothetical protein [Chloroflexota bacterium]
MATSTPTPTATIPPYHYATRAEAEAGAIKLGCSGWNQAKVDGTTYFRACASGASFESLVSATIKPASDAQIAITPSPTTTISLPPTSTPTISAQPTSTPVPQTAAPAHAPPPYHYATRAEAEAGAEELGCSGFNGVRVEGTFYYRACGSDESYELLASGAPITLSGAPCKLESDATVRFSATLTDLTQIASIVPAGSPSGGVIKPHSYLHNKDLPGGKNVRVPVYAIADSVLTSVAYYDTSVGTSEYLIFFDVTCEISYKFDHIMSVAPKILAVAPEIPSDTSEGNRTPAITFKAGELIGYANGAGGQGAWDFGVYDTTYTNQFANQERYVKGNMGQLLHTVCPYDYFTEPLKSQMYALLGTHDQRLVPDVECTTTQRDVPGAVAGAWFDTQVLEFSDAKVAIAMLPGDIVAITGIGGDVRISKGQPTWLDPGLLTTTHCYSGSGRWFFIEIQADGMEMAIADGSGGCPGALPAGATVYYR